MKASLRPEMTEGRLIRDVGPKKMMTLVSFRLTEEMIDRSNKREKDSEGSCEEGKRVKVWIVCWEKRWGGGEEDINMIQEKQKHCEMDVLYNYEINC